MAWLFNNDHENYQLKFREKCEDTLRNYLYDCVEFQQIIEEINSIVEFICKKEVYRVELGIFDRYNSLHKMDSHILRNYQNP